MFRLFCAVASLGILLPGCVSNPAGSGGGDSLARELEAERSKSASLSGQLRISDAEVLRLKSELKDAQTALADLKTKHDAEIADLKKKSDILGQLAALEGVSVDKKGMVEISGLSFKTGEAELTPDALKRLAKVAETLVNHKGLICVDGHTDNIPVGKPETKDKFVDNLGLSVARAAAVARILVDNKVPADKLIVRGFGDTKPVASNDTDDGREKNRRVEIRLVAPAPADTK